MIKVYHHPRFMEVFSLGFGELVNVPEKSDYVHVADVETSDLDEAMYLTNNIDASWTLNVEVTPESGRHRSTSVGDAMVDSLGEWHIVSPMGFLPLDCKGQYCSLNAFSDPQTRGIK